MKKCKVCQKEKEIKNDFPSQKSRGKEYYNNTCKECTKENQKEYRRINKIEIKRRNKKFYEKIKNTITYVNTIKQYSICNKKKKSEYDKKYREENREKYKKYCENNKEKIIENRRRYYLNNKINRNIYNKMWTENNKIRRRKINTKAILKRLKLDLNFKLKRNVSRSINKYFKLNNFSKNNNSILKFLPYTIQELKQHLELQFEPWMNWSNWGSYKKDIWNDDNSSTWVWNIDHIIPHSTFKYESMDCEEFRKCWALENLRPLSAKQNILDGNRL